MTSSEQPSSFVDWLGLEGASDAAISSELREGFSILFGWEREWEAGNSPPIIHETAHLSFHRTCSWSSPGWQGIPYIDSPPDRGKLYLVRYRSIPMGRPGLLFLRKGDSPSLPGILFFIRELWTDNDIPQDGSVSPEEWIVRSVMES